MILVVLETVAMNMFCDDNILFGRYLNVQDEYARSIFKLEGSSLLNSEVERFFKMLVPI
jgi:hypothetical protein